MKISDRIRVLDRVGQYTRHQKSIQIATEADAVMLDLKEALKMVLKANNENIDGGFLRRDEAVVIFAALKHYKEYVK